MKKESVLSFSADLHAAGFGFRTEARVVRNGDFAGVFHVVSGPDGAHFDPAVVVYAPGKWHDPASAHLAAQGHAVTMAEDGALGTAIRALRQPAIG